MSHLVELVGLRLLFGGPQVWGVPSCLLAITRGSQVIRFFSERATMLINQVINHQARDRDWLGLGCCLFQGCS